MSSLWTPGGEHRVPRPGEPSTAGSTGTPAGAASVEGSPGTAAPPGGLGPEDEEAVRAELDEIERQLTAAPVEDVVANHCYGLFQLAALHLRERPPHLEAARLAIDALGAVVDTLGERLGEATASLQEALATIRLTYVQVAGAAQGAGGGADRERGAAG